MVETTQAAGSKTFRLQVISPERVMFDTAARSIQVWAIDGQLGVLPHHAPLVTPLVPGVLDVVNANGEKLRFAVGEGFLEVLKDEVRVLVDSAESPEQIDVERAERARKRAEERLARRSQPDIDAGRAEAALKRAIARLRTVGRN